MARKSSKISDKIGDTAWAAQGERYVQRLIEDEELRGRLLGAYASARSAYGRLANGKGPTHALFEDPKLQQELIDAATALREASTSLIETGSRKPVLRKRGRRRSVRLLLVGGVLALALSADLRKKVLDMMFGAEETFDYSSTTTPATPAPSPVAG